MSTRAYTMTPVISAAAAATLAFVFVPACGDVADEADDFRGGVPRHEDVAMTLPGAAASSAALEGGAGGPTMQSALLGERAELYKLTRAITDSVNGGTALVLGLVKTIVEFPPTSISGDLAVWGPHSEPLKPNAWRLTVRRVALGQFDYVLDAKDKMLDDTAFVTVLRGHHTVADPQRRGRWRDRAPRFGSGDFTLDWDGAQTLPEHENKVGKVHITYARPSATAPVTIRAAFTQVRDEETGMLVDATYKYEATAGAGGRFQFALTKNEIATTAALETLTVQSRWRETGAGRSDVKLVGGDLGTVEGTASECWDTSFASVYMTNNYGEATKMWGQETDCAFVPAEYAAPGLN